MDIKLALVTGASSGIGESLSRLLASKKIELIITGRNQSRLEALQKSLDITSTIVIADLSQSEDRKKLVQVITDRLPDLIVNNAGMGVYGDVLSTPLSAQLNIINVNLIAPFEITVEAAHSFIKQKKQGIIFNVSSVAGEVPTPGSITYGATKAFLTHFSSALDTELKPKGVRVLVCCPGMVHTEFSERAGGRKTEHSRMTMSSEYVAQKIWEQIEKGSGKRIISWRYTIIAWLAKSLLPGSWVKKIVYQAIQEKIK